ncbi:MAG: hypothetical protein MJ185_08710 [Treponema sp.]|nr:hypothetical protein [Treponema sp.]
MNEKKLIFFDIDGTLLTETKDHLVPESPTKALDLKSKIPENIHAVSEKDFDKSVLINSLWPVRPNQISNASIMHLKMI